MPSCDVILSYEYTGSDAIQGFPYGAVSGSATRRHPWWEHLDNRVGCKWQEFLTAKYETDNPCITEIEVNEQQITVTFLTGGFGFDMGECLVRLLHESGCQAVEAIVYNDECDYIEDEDGESHPIGLRYYIDANGNLQETDYPEVKYEYYD